MWATRESEAERGVEKTEQDTELLTMKSSPQCHFCFAKESSE